MTKMWKFLALCGLLCYTFTLVESTGDIGPGMWSVQYINKCEEEKHKFKFDVLNKRINRTHDGFDASIVLDEDFTDIFSVRIDICKKVDGGCKPFHVLSDSCLINFINQYAKNNVKACLEIAGVEGASFPVAKGEYNVKDFVFDYSELPKNSTYGEFTAKCYMLEGNEEVGCVEAEVEFSEYDEEDEEK